MDQSKPQSIFFYARGHFQAIDFDPVFSPFAIIDVEKLGLVKRMNFDDKVVKHIMIRSPKPILKGSLEEFVYEHISTAEQLDGFIKCLIAPEDTQVWVLGDEMMLKLALSPFGQLETSHGGTQSVTCVDLTMARFAGNVVFHSIKSGDSLLDATTKLIDSDFFAAEGTSRYGHCKKTQ